MPPKLTENTPDPFVGKFLGNLQVIKRVPRETRKDTYLVRCSICSEDPELFGEGLFEALRGNLLKGRLPCGCSSKYKWTEEQTAVRVSRKCSEVGYRFLGFSEPFKGNKTKIKLYCDFHSLEWTTTTVFNFIFRGKACPNCALKIQKESRLIEDIVMVERFFQTKAFHPNSTFTRLSKGYWEMFCGSCKVTCSASATTLAQGCIPCNCSSNKQTFAYIHLIKDGGIPVAIKYGITKYPELRVKQQSNLCIFDVGVLAVFEFKDHVSCKSAESECKKPFDRRVLSKIEMPDGWTETTFTFNVNKIIEIYESHGGTRLEQGEDIPWS